MESPLMMPRTTGSTFESSRLASIDAARGAAMMFVCLAHFGNYYPFASVGGEVGILLYAIGMVASPTFVTVSGMVAGFMSVARRRSFPHFRRKLVDRGVFLLLVGHAVLASMVVLAGKSLSFAYRIEYITDAIAVAIIIGPWLASKLQQKWRLLLAIGIFAMDWCAILFWQPSAGLPTLAKHYLVGLLNPADLGVRWPAFPVIPWFAVYLVGTVIGEGVGAYYIQERRKEGHQFLAKIGLASFLVGFGIKLAFVLLKHSVPDFVQVHPNLMPLLSNYQKYPPGPIYACFYTGAGLLLVAGVLEAGRLGIQTFLFNQLRRIGQASLFSYVVQFQLYSVMLPRLRLEYTPFWPILFVLSLVVLTAAAAVWNAIDGNRFLTVGIGPLLERNALRRREIRDGQIRVDFSPAAVPARLDGLPVTPTSADAIYRRPEFQERKRVSQAL
jgi:uncharacterized membrane protein